MINTTRMKKSNRRIYISLILAGAAMPFIMAGVALAATVPSSSASSAQHSRMGGFTHGTFTGQRPVAFGKVTAVSGTTLTVLDSKTSVSYTVDVSSAKITEGFGTGAQSIGYTSVKVGDEVVIMGTVSGDAVTATSVFDGVEAHGHGVHGTPRIIGTVAGVNGTSITLTVNTHAKRGATASTAAPTTYTVNTTSATTVTKDGKADTFSDIAVGQTIMAVGTVDAASDTVAATKINIVTRVPQAHVTGSVTAISGTTLTVQTKNGTTYTVDASSATVATGFGKNAQPSSLSSISVGQNVMVIGSHVSGSTNIVATSVRLVQPRVN